VGLTRAMAEQVGMKRNKIMELIPLIVLGVVIIIAVVGYMYLGNISKQVGSLQQQINLTK